MSIIPNLDTMTDEEKLAALESIQQSIRESKELQKQKVAKNVDLVVQALKKIESDIRTRFEGVGTQLEKRISNIKDGRDGIDGRDGKDGDPGRPGKDGKDGRPGRDGKDGVNGVDGQDGISVVNVFLDFDNSLVIELSDGRQINAGEILPPDIADRLKVVINQGASGGGGGASLPDQTGNSGKFLTTDGTNASWGTPAGSGDVVGPSSATDNALARFDTTTGKLIQNSVVTVSDTGAVAGVRSTAHTAISAPTYAEGLVWYDSTAKALSYYADVSGVDFHIGHDLQFKVINNTGSTIPNGSPVYITGTSSGQTYPNVALARADVAATAAVIGLTDGPITNGSAGYVTSIGNIDDVNTGSFTVGQVLYLSPYSAGQLMNTVPPTGITVQVGVVTFVNSSTGKIYVKQTTPLNVPASIISGAVAVANGGTGQTSFTDGQLLIGNSTGNTLTKATLTAGSGITVTNAAGSITIAASGGGGSGDVVGPASSTDNAVARFDGTTGKLVQNSSFVVNDSGEVTTGVWKGTEVTVPYGGTGVATLTGIVKGNGASAFSAATAGTDYLAPPSGTAILKANSGGALANATAGTDYLAPPSGTAILKANSGGALANAVAGTDYAPATSGTSILYGDGSGGFSNVTVGTGLSFSAGTLSATGGSGGTSIGLVRAIAINCILP